MKSYLDDVVICLALLLGFSTSLILLVANESWGTHFPSSAIAFFAAISVAALIYRFRGGSGEAEFRMGVLQLGGSAAILLGATWFLGDRIRLETMLYSTDAQYRPALEADKATIELLRQERSKLVGERDDIKDQFEQLRAGKSGYSLDQVRHLRVDDPFVSGIRRMVINEDPPFRQTLKEIAAKVTINDAMSDTNVYRICTDTQARLFEGLDVEKDRLRMRRTFGDAESRSVEMVRGGIITSDGGACPPWGARTFDIQITCADALKLFPDRIQRCMGNKPMYQPGVTVTIRGERVMLGVLPPH